MTQKPESDDYRPKTRDELVYWRTVVTGLRVLVLSALNHVDQVLSEIDAQIDVAKKRIEQPAKRCNFCGVKIVFRRVVGNWRAFELDATTEHRCLEKEGDK